MTTIFFSGGSSGETTPEKILSDKANVMPSFFYGALWTSKTEHYEDGTKKSGIRVDVKPEPTKRMKRLVKMRKQNIQNGDAK